MREPTALALLSVQESKKAVTQTMGKFETIRLRPSQRDFLRASKTKSVRTLKIGSAAARTAMANSSASLRSDSDRHHLETVIGIKSESVITFVGIRKHRQKADEGQGTQGGSPADIRLLADTSID
jgi:hypothetical protein